MYIKAYSTQEKYHKIFEKRENLEIFSLLKNLVKRDNPAYEKFG
jgi:hypothetical protein